MYRFDIVYIWQHQVGEYAHLNGTETTVIEGPDLVMFDDGERIAWLTDTALPDPKDDMFAFIGDLRPKYPPEDNKQEQPRSLVLAT